MLVVNDLRGRFGFNGARINIVENSDNHGNLNNLPDFYNAIKQNGGDIFQKAEDPSTLNLYINAGDFFMNPSKTGWMSCPEKSNGDVQRDFLQLLIQKIKKVANTGCFNINEAEKKKGNKSNLQARFDALYTPGNHCYDGGDEMLYKLLGSIEGLTTVITNIEQKKSPFLQGELDKPGSNFATKKIYEIPDDKDPKKSHHLMVLGAVIPAMGFYNPDLLKGTEFLDEKGLKDTKMGKDDILRTIDAIKAEVEAFRAEHPKGIIILSSHMGTKLSKIIRDEVPGIAEILDAHKHDIVTTSNKNGTNISSLGMDNDIVKAISIIINDEGEIEERESRTYASEQYRLEEEEWPQNSIYRMLMNNYEEDHKPLVKIFGGSLGVQAFEYRPNIRSANSNLANFLTTSVKRAIVEIPGQQDVDLVGIQSSIIRGGLKHGSNNFDLFKVFDGVSEDLSDVKVGTINGKELTGLIIENVKDNIQDPKRNTIIHWSDIRINRGEMAKILKADPDASDDVLAEHIGIRQLRHAIFKPIVPDRNYKIAIADKYLKKTDIKTPALIADRFTSIGQTYHTLFKSYLENITSRYYEVITDDTCSEERIISEEKE